MTEHDPTRPVGNQSGADHEATEVHQAVEAPVEGPNGRPASTVPVATTVDRSGARRWGIALVVVALVIGVVAAGLAFVAGSSSPSAILAWVPDDAIAYADARLDLPGDQRQKVGDLLSKFPGFADQSTLETKIDEVLDRFVGDATSGSQTYSADIKPWFGGELGIAVGTLPDVSALESDPMGSETGLALISVSDSTRARAWLDEVIEEPTGSESYRGVDLVFMGPRKEAAAGIVDDSVMLLGTTTSVKAAIDSDGQGGLGTNEQFRDAQDATSGDHLAWFYVDTSAYIAWLEQAGASLGGGTSGLGLIGMATDKMPPWMAGSLRSEGDALVVEVVNPHVDGGIDRENRTSTIAAHVPADTLLLVDVHDAGASLAQLVDTVRSNPDTADAFRDIESGVAILGGFDGLIGWIGDAGLVVTASGSDIGGGLVVSATDVAAAERFTSTITGLVAIGGGQLGVETRTEDYNGVTITFLDASAAVDASGGLGVEVPEIAWAATDDVVVVGVGETFVKSVIDTTADSSLASNDRYEAIANRVGGENVTSSWVDVVALRGLIETMGAEVPGGLGDYETEVKPYLEPFDAIASASVSGGDFDRTTVMMSVK